MPSMGTCLTASSRFTAFLWWGPERTPGLICVKTDTIATANTCRAEFREIKHMLELSFYLISAFILNLKQFKRLCACDKVWDDSAQALYLSLCVWGWWRRRGHCSRSDETTKREWKKKIYIYWPSTQPVSNKMIKTRTKTTHICYEHRATNTASKKIPTCRAKKKKTQLNFTTKTLACQTVHLNANSINHQIRVY